MSQVLAIDGGLAVRRRPWPAWPRATPAAEQRLVDVLHSGRWTVSGAYTGRPSYEQRFAQAFALFHGVDYCVPTCHGSSALVIALEALGVGVGAEVLVPGLTWVACASAVVRVGAIPVLVDVDEETVCMSLAAAEAALTERTAAILVVHSFCSSVDLDGFVELSRRHGVPLLEDCSQAHGARWRGKRVGSFGAIGAFSFQQTKLLTSGEGGATLTADPTLYDRLEQLRADGRRHVAEPTLGHLELEEVGAIQGHNYCLSEFHAALLLSGLDRLDEENSTRRANASVLAGLLAESEGVALIGHPSGLSEPAFYHCCMRVEPATFGSANVDWIAAAVGAELGLLVEPVDDPLNANLLYAPTRSPAVTTGRGVVVDPRRFELPAAERVRRTCLTLPHHALLGTADDMADIVVAFEKVRAHARSHRVATSGAVASA